MHFHNKYLAEFFGTFWLVLGGCGSAVFAATFANDIGINIGLVGVSLAFGLTVMTMALPLGMCLAVISTLPFQSVSGLAVDLVLDI